VIAVTISDAPKVPDEVSRYATPPSGTDLRPLALRAGLIVLLTAGCAIAVASGGRSPLRTVFSVGFLLFGPGLALAELLEIGDLAQRLTIATGASLALDTLLALGLVYAGAFSVGLAIGILAAITLAVLGVAVLRARGGGHPTAGRYESGK
jgi:uncharacterized membrane protein